MMLEQQLESSTSQCTALQEELKAKIDGEHEFEEKILNLERECLEQQGFIESLREEKISIQETSDDLGTQSKGDFLLYIRLHIIRLAQSFQGIANRLSYHKVLIKAIITASPPHGRKTKKGKYQITYADL